MNGIAPSLHQSRALTALRQRKFQEGLLTKTDGQLETITELVSSNTQSAFLKSLGTLISLHHRLHHLAIDNRVLSAAKPGAPILAKRFSSAERAPEGDESRTSRVDRRSGGRRCCSTAGEYHLLDMQHVDWSFC
jgi:hypothetical protein